MQINDLQYDIITNQFIFREFMTKKNELNDSSSVTVLVEGIVRKADLS